MKQISATFWNVTGWISLLLTATSFVFATIDGVMAMFLVSFAMLVGGISGIGTRSTARFGLATMLLGSVLVFGMTHYVVSTGFEVPSLVSLTRTFALIAIPLAVSGGMLLRGVNVRRNKASGSAGANR